jgi:ACS family glucarate transporter-like MFS transporter
MAGVTTPLVIGAIVQRTHSYNGALIFVGAIAFCAILSYGPLVGEIKRLEIAPSPETIPAR